MCLVNHNSKSIVLCALEKLDHNKVIMAFRIFLSFFSKRFRSLVLKKVPQGYKNVKSECITLQKLEGSRCGSFLFFWPSRKCFPLWSVYFVMAHSLAIEILFFSLHSFSKFSGSHLRFSAWDIWDWQTGHDWEWYTQDAFVCMWQMQYSTKVGREHLAIFCLFDLVENAFLCGVFVSVWPIG